MIRRIATLLISITLILTISWFVVGCKDDVQLAKSQVQIKEPEKCESGGNESWESCYWVFFSTCSVSSSLS